MARRKSFNRVHRRNSRRSIDSIGSGVLDPNTTVIDEEQTFWWNHLQENTFPPHSSIYNEDETARHLSVNSQTDSRQGTSEWWKNLEQSDDEQVASTSSRHNLSAVIVNTNILQASTSSESEKERDLRKKKVRLKANSRKSSNNDFEDALNNISTVAVPLKLRMKRANYSNFHSDSNREVSQEKLQENEEDSNLSSTGNILKSKPSISRKRRGTEDQNAFQNVLTEDDVLNASVRREVSREKLQENEENSHLSPTGNILKSKPSISRKRRGTEDQNAFQNVLTEDDVLNASVRREVSREKLHENEEDSNLSSTGNILKSKPTISRKRRGRSKEDQYTFKNILTEGDVVNASIRREVSQEELQENEENSHLSPTGNILKSKPSISRKRRSTKDQNAFLNILTEGDVLNASVRREVSQEELQENEEDSNLSPTDNILKSKQTISRKRKGGSIEDQNTFQNILTEDVLNASTTRKSVALEKESSRRSMHRIDANKDRTDDQRKSMSESQAMPLRSDTDSLNLLTSNTETAMLKGNANEIAQSSNESNISIERNKFQSRLKQRTRKSVGKNAFADALADDSSPNLFDLHKKNDIHVSPLLSPSKRSVNQSKNKIDITHQSSSIRRSSQSSLNIAKKQSLNASVQPKDNIEINSSSSSLSNNESRGMKRSIFLKPKSILKGVQRKSPTKNLFKEIFEKDDNINARKSIVSIKNTHASFKQSETTTSQVYESSTAESLVEESSQSQKNGSMNENEYDDLFLAISPNTDSIASKEFPSIENVSLKNKSKQSDNSDLTKASKSISQKGIIAKTPEKQNSSSRKSTREETLNEHTQAEAILRIDRTRSETTKYGATGDNEDLNLSKRTRSSPDKEARLTRSRLRNQSEISRLANTGVQEVADQSRNREYNSGTPERASKSSPSKEGRLTRNSLRDRSETPRRANTDIQKVIDNSRNETNREYGSGTPNRSSKSSPDKEARLTRNSLRDRSETPRRANTSIQKVIDNSRNETNRDYDSGTPNRSSKSSPDKEARLTRNNLRDRSETPRRANTDIQKVIDNSRNETNRDYDSGTPNRASKSSPDKEARLTRNSLRDRSEIPRRANTDIQKVIDNSRNETNRDYDSGTPNRSSKSSPDKEARLTRNSLRNRFETSKSANMDKELSKRFTNRIIDNIDENSEINVDNISQIISSTRISKGNANTGTPKRIVLSTEMETTDGEDADPVRQTIQRDSTSTRVDTSNKTVNRQSVQNSSRIGIRDGIETARRQKSMNKSQNYRNTSVKSSNKGNSFNKENSSKTLGKIDDFFKVKQASTMEQSSERAQKSQVFGSEKMDKIKTVLEKIKNREMAAMKIAATDKRESALKAKNVKSIKQGTKKKPLANNPTTKKVDKAFLINGAVYKAPRLPRPKHWATNRLYKFLWVRMEPKYKLAAQLKSEKFIRKLSEVISLIERRKDYKNYKTEIRALVKEMARLKIINTYNDFLNFCQDFLPYEFRIKVVPMILPGNKNNVPCDMSKLHVPVLDSSTNE